MKTFKTFSIALLLWIMASVAIQAQTTTTDVPKTITYQGAINTQDGTPIADGQYNITVSLYADANGTSKVWSGSYTTTVTKGIFNLMLGSGSSPFTSTSMFNQPLWVGVKVGDGDEMRPLTQLSSAPSALGIPDSSVTASKMGTNYVAGITVNGTPITGVGSTVNLVGAGSTSLLYDQQTNSIIVNAAGVSNTGDTMNSNGSFKGNGGGTEATGSAVQEGVGAGPGFGGTVGYIPIWQTIGGAPPIPSTIANSSVSDNGVTVTVNNAPGAAVSEATISEVDGTVNSINGEYQIAGLPMLTIKPLVGIDNTFVGIRANVPIIGGGNYNTATGFKALSSNTSGYDNDAYGYLALSNNTTIGANVGITNDAFGTLALTANTTGESNDAFGYEALASTTTPNNNSGFGFKAGLSNVLGANNTFIGYNTAATNINGSNLTMLGFQADVAVDHLSNATAIGNGAIVGSSNAIQLGNTAVTAVTTAGTLTTGMTAAGTAGSLIFNDGTASGFTSSFTIGTQAANIAYVLPPAQGLANTFLRNDGLGNLAWVAVPGGVSAVTASAPLASSGGATPNISLTGIVGTANGGTGLNTSAASNGQLLIGNGSGLSLATLTAGTNITITNSAGGIKIDASGSLGVTNVTASSPLASSGGATPNISLTGIVGVANGGTGDNTLTAHGILIGEGTSAVVVSSAMTAGQLLVGQGATDPLPETIGQDVTLAASGNATVVGIQTIPVSATAPTLNQVLQYNGSSWVPTSFSPGGVTAVTASVPLASTGGATPNISVTPGANNTFLTTNNIGVVGFNALSVDGVTLKGDGSSSALAINLDNANIWTNIETFAPRAAHNVASLVVNQTAAVGPVSDVLTVEDKTATNNFLRVQNNGDVEISANGNVLPANVHIHAGGVSVVPVALGVGVIATASVLQDNDIAGIADFGMGGAPGVPGNQMGICVNNNYPVGSTVAIVISGTDVASANLNPYAIYTVGGCAGGGDQITIGTGNPPAPHQTYTFAYHVMYLK
jgi:hypothetical protein